jgi:uncharacterized protein
MFRSVAIMSRLSRAALIVAAVTWVMGGVGRAQEPRLDYFRIGTGSPVGTYFPVGELIGGLISLPPGAATCEAGGHCGVPGLIAVAQDSPGSVANVTEVAKGRYDSALAQADVINAAYFGEHSFAERGGHPDIRVIANLYTETVHLAVRKGAGIESVSDLRGKRVSVDTAQSGTQRNALLILNAFGLGRDKLKLAELNLEQAADQLLEGNLDAFFLVTGYPAGGITDLVSNEAIDLLPISGDVALKLQQDNPYFVASAIPADTYPGIEEIASLGIGAQWIVRSDHDEQRIYQITRALWHPTAREALDAGHTQARKIRPETSLHGVTVPLHAGALRYYLESGILE